VRSDGFRNRVTLTFDHLLTSESVVASESVHAERLLLSIRVQSLVSIAQPVSFQSADKQTDATECLTHAGGYAGVGNENSCILYNVLTLSP